MRLLVPALVSEKNKPSADHENYVHTVRTGRLPGAFLTAKKKQM